MNAPAARRDLVVISQVPPPVHGQTLMTKRTLELLAHDGCRLRLVDRRFSRSIDEVGIVGARKVVAALGLLGRLITTVVRRRPDAVLLFATTRPASFAVDVLLTAVLRALRVPVIVSVHSVGFRRIAGRSAIGRAAVRLLLSTAFRVVCLGPSLTDDVRPFVGTDRVRLIANTPPVVPGDDGRTPHRRRTVLWLSNIIAGKGAERFAEVVAALDPEVVAEYRMVGPVADPAIAVAVEERVASVTSGRFRMTGAAYGDAKWTELRSAAVLAFTSELQEAQPLTIVEAMACGVPVVAFDRGGVRDLVRNGVTGFLVAPGDVAGFAARVRAVLDDAALAERLGRGALGVYAAQHAPDAHTEAWRSLLDELPAVHQNTTTPGEQS